MGFRGLVITISALFTANALAFSVPNKPAGCANSQAKQSVLNDFSDISGMIEKVAVRIDGADDRGPTKQKANEVGFTARDTNQIDTAFGETYCPGTTHKNGGWAAGALVGANDQIVTTAHSFIDNKTGLPRDPLSQCYWQSMTDNTRHYFNLKDGQAGIDEAVRLGLIRLGAPTMKDDNFDRVVVKLKHPILDVKPFSVSSSPMKVHGCEGILDDCQTMVVTSAIQLRMKEPVVGDSVTQRCHPRDVYSASPGRGRVVLNDCSATKGASGSLAFLKDETGQLIRDREGYLQVFGIIAGDGNESKDGLPYSVSEGRFTKALLLDGAAADDILEMSGTRTAQRAVPPVR